jgi:hypothetical protein
MKEFVLRNEKAKVVTVAPLGLVFRFLKHECPDGEYSVEGPGTNCTVTRKDGILYPSSGVIKGVPFEPRNLDECREYFEGS